MSLPGFRQRMVWLHNWTGVLLGSLLYFIFLTGTAGYFDTEIDRWMRPELPMATPVSALRMPEVAEAAAAHLHKHAAQSPRWFIELPSASRPDGGRSTPYPRVVWPDAQAAHGEREALLDAATGRPLHFRDTGAGQQLYRMHWQLHYLPPLASAWLVGAATLTMLLALVTGVIAHRRIFADFFTFRPAKGQRSWLDAHNLLGVLALPFHLMITYSGLVFFAVTLVPWILALHYGTGPQAQGRFFADLQVRDSLPRRSGQAAPLAPLGTMVALAERRWGPGQVAALEVRHPGDASARVAVRQQLEGGPLRNGAVLHFDGVTGRLLADVPPVVWRAKAVHDVLLGLHEGLFADLALRWLYFACGLVGAAMVATGLVLWTAKRRQRLERSGQPPDPGLRLMERINAATVLGLPTAIAAYFWANRLIPAAWPERADWEVHALFITWGLMLLHAALRPLQRAWREQAWMAALAFALLPALNALTTQRHLGISLAQGDWVMAGTDLVFLALGSVFAVLGWRLAMPAHAGTPRAAATGQA